MSEDVQMLANAIERLVDKTVERIVKKVTQPTGHFDLEDVERELAAETGISAKDARCIVAAYDRKKQVRVEDLANAWEKWRRNRN